MPQKINIQYLVSYLGLIPYFYILFDKIFLYQIKEEILINFAIYYSLIIIVFIGSINWNLELRIKNHIVFYGVVPSIFALNIIILNLYNFNQTKIIISIFSFIILQLFFDYILIYIKKIDKTPFYFLRAPLSLIITLILIIIIT